MRRGTGRDVVHFLRDVDQTLRLIREPIEAQPFLDWMADQIDRHTVDGVTPSEASHHVLATIGWANEAGYQHDDDGTLWPRLVEVLLSIERAEVVLSSYPGPELEPLEQAGWRRVDLNASCASSVTRAGRGMAPEAVWLSPTVQEPHARLWTEAIA